MTTFLTTFTLARATGAPVEAPALISPTAFSARYDLDRETGVISRVDHPLRGISVAGTILICPAVQGGVAAGWTFMKLAGLGVGFAGIVFGRTNPVMVQGAQAAGLPIGAGIDADAFDLIPPDAIVRLDPPARQLTVISPPSRAGG